MEFREFLKIFWQKKGVVVVFVLVFLVVAMAFVVFTPLKYRATSRVLIMQDFSQGANSYTITQSNNNLSELLARVVGSSSFFKDVINSGYNVETEYFSPTGDSQEMVKKWKDTVEATAVKEGGGIIEINVYHIDKAQARQVSEAVNYILKTKHADYHSLKDRLNIKIIDSPTVSNLPVKPNIFYVFSLAFILGLAVAGSYIYLFYSPSGHDREKLEEDVKETPDIGQESPQQEHKYKDENKKEDVSSRETNIPFIPIKHEDEEEFLGKQEPQNDSQAGVAQPVDSQSREQEREEDVLQSPSAGREKDPREIEEKGDMRNIWE